MLTNVNTLNMSNIVYMSNMKFVYFGWKMKRKTGYRGYLVDRSALKSSTE